MNIIFLEIKCVLDSFYSNHSLSLAKLQKLNRLVNQTHAQIVITSRATGDKKSVEEYKDTICKSWRRHWWPDGAYEAEIHSFARSICDMLPPYKECNAQTGYSGGKGEAIKTWLAAHQADNIERYVIIDAYCYPYLDEQVFRLVQTHRLFGLSDWTIDCCASLLKGEKFCGGYPSLNERLYELEKAKGWEELYPPRGERQKKKGRWRKK